MRARRSKRFVIQLNESIERINYHTEIKSIIIHYYQYLVIQSNVRTTHTETQHPRTHRVACTHTRTRSHAHALTHARTHAHTHTHTHTHAAS